MTNPPLSPFVEERLVLLFHRLRCAVLKLSGGDLEKLRDVLMAADFGAAESYKFRTPERTW